jgi:hypothetical protein
VLASALGLVVVAATAWGARFGLEARAVARYLDREIAVPADHPPALLFRWFDTTSVDVQFTAGWEKFTRRVPRYQFRADHPVWARMHFEDWDRLPAHERQEPLRNMLVRSGPVMHAGDCWPLMTAGDWDVVPQPIRAVAILGVLEYWTRYYGVGELFDHEIAQMVQVVQAIVMSESWFEHRAITVNEWGNRDLGLGQASDHARALLTKYFEAGKVDIAFEDDDYFNPWKAARFVAVWMSLILDDVDGDLDMAVRAYHRGSVRALRGKGDEYLAAVKRRRQAFMRNTTTSPTWRYLWFRDRTLTRERWPWLEHLPAAVAPPPA